MNEYNLKPYFCTKPFEQIDIYYTGDVSPCCKSWINNHCERIDDHNGLFQLYNSSLFQKIRQSMHDGTFEYCNKDICPMIQSRILPLKTNVKSKIFQKYIKNRQVEKIKPRFFNLCYDETCNLKCKSCRYTHINHYEGSSFEYRQKIHTMFINEFFSEPNLRKNVIHITGSGDPFASKIFSNFLYTFNGNDFPNTVINLQTNGVLLNRETWKMMSKIQDNISIILISCDASTSETYGYIRKGGDWFKLNENLKFLSELKNTRKIDKLRIDFVVQKANYKEMIDFIKLGKYYNVDSVFFSMLCNWGTWTSVEYENLCVWDERNDEYNAFIDILKNPIFNDPIVDLSNLTEYKNIASGPNSRWR